MSSSVASRRDIVYFPGSLDRYIGTNQQEESRKIAQNPPFNTNARMANDYPQIHSACCEAALEGSLPLDQVDLQTFFCVVKDGLTMPYDDAPVEE